MVSFVRRGCPRAVNTADSMALEALLSPSAFLKAGVQLFQNYRGTLWIWTPLLDVWHVLRGFEELNKYVLCSKEWFSASVSMDYNCSARALPVLFYFSLLDSKLNFNLLMINTKTNVQSTVQRNTECCVQNPQRHNLIALFKSITVIPLSTARPHTCCL